MAAIKVVVAGLTAVPRTTPVANEEGGLAALDDGKDLTRAPSVVGRERAGGATTAAGSRSGRLLPKK